MQYVEVLVSDATYHGQEALTYVSERTLQVGTLVMVPLRHKKVIGVVSKVVSRPSFAVKHILEIPDASPLPETSLELLHWIKGYYPAPLGLIVQQFLPKELSKTYDRFSLDFPDPQLPTLTQDQKRALSAIDGPGMFLLHGETGSGKTRVYLEFAKKTIREGASVILLTPEIGLTSQLANDFRNSFGERVIVFHSQLSTATRRKLWTSILNQSDPLIVVGPRSALFVPLKNIGLIVVDEAHETAYKQDQSPHYHASHVAAKLANLHGATLILGSATPLVTDYYIAAAKHRPIIRMKQLALNSVDMTKKIHVVDLKERSLFTKSPFLSNPLLESIKEASSKHEQSLLFLNRRGTARVVFCERCGWQANCPNCDLPLVYHGDAHRLQCHSCSYRAAPPSACPECNNAAIVFKSIGTKAIVEEVKRLFPEANVQRFDTDNKKDERIEQHYEKVKSGEVDIIVGTQTLAKGIDLPKLALVGVIAADAGLYFPDFSAQERTYQLLRQVIGRIGRGHRSNSTAIIQTYNPGSPLLAAVLHDKWSIFYDKELAERRQFLFPPYCYLLKLSCRRASSGSAEQAATRLKQNLQEKIRSIIVEGPTPSFHEKIQNKYQWQLVIKSKDRRELLNVISLLPANWSYDIDPLNLL